MTDIVTDLRRRVRDAGTNLMLEPLRTEDARALLAQYDAMVEDKRRLMEIADDLSAQNTALNRMLQGVVEQPHVECFGCGAREVLVTGRGDLAGRAMFNMQCTVCGRQWSQVVDYVETETEGDGIDPTRESGSDNPTRDLG